MKKLMMALAFVGLCKRAVKQDFSSNGLLAEKGASYQPNACRTGGVRAGRANHHRAQNVENVHREKISLLFVKIVVLFFRIASFKGTHNFKKFIDRLNLCNG